MGICFLVRAFQKTTLCIGSDQAEAVCVASLAGFATLSKCETCTERRTIPRAPSQYPWFFALCLMRKIKRIVGFRFKFCVGVCCIMIARPFPEISEHIIQPPRIRLFLPNRMRCSFLLLQMIQRIFAVVAPPSDIVDMPIARALDSSASRIFPFSFCRQPPTFLGDIVVNYSALKRRASGSEVTPHF